MTSQDTGVLEVRSLTKQFGEGSTSVRAVENVDFGARRGEVVLIMGPSGSGKTTLLTMIGGLLHPSSGSIRLFGRELTDMQERELALVRRQSVGFIFQSFNLLEALTAEQNVEVALNLRGVKGAKARERARALLRRVSMEQRLAFRPRQLSGGERQRVSIARALANDAPLILADEPTANLDSASGGEVVRLLSDIAREEGRTVVIVSHDARILTVADTVYWLEDGHLRPEAGRGKHGRA